MTEVPGFTGELYESRSEFEGAPRAAATAMIDGVALDILVGSSDLDVKLRNDMPISALRFELTFRDRFNYRAPDLSSRIEALNNYINFQDNVVTCVLLDLDGKGIAPGNGTIIRIPSGGSNEFEVTAAYASTRTSGISSIKYNVLKEPPIEESLVLEQNDPNPFSGRTRLDFQIPGEADTKLMIYDVGGALIRTLVDSRLDAGTHSAEWDGRDDVGKAVESGIYMYKLYAGVYSVTRKMVYLK